MYQRVFTITEAAQFIGVSSKTLRRWEKAKKLVPKRTKGGQRRYHRTELKPFRRVFVVPRIVSWGRMRGFSSKLTS